MTNIELFDQQFPGSKYREIYAQYTGDDHKQYQDSKAPMNSTVLDFDNVKDTPNRIGWIIPQAYCAIDIDNKNESRIVYNMLKALDIRFMFMVGKHGGHFIFKNERGIDQGVKIPTSIGFKVDVRAKEKGYIILPWHDTDRKWGEITSDIDDVPFFLVPCKKLKVETDFIAMCDGDGRNSELFKHFLNLKDYAEELTLEEKVKSIKLINQYVLAEPIPDKELHATVLRDEIIKKEAKSHAPGKKETLEQLATRFVSEKRMITVNDYIYRFNGKFYEPCSDLAVQRVIHEEYARNLLEADRKEIIKFIKLKTYTEPRDVNKNWNEIVCKNGILNISTMTLTPHTPIVLDTIYIDYNFRKTPVSSAIDNFMEQISNGDEQKKQLFYEMIGYCFLQAPILSKFFICYGEGQTGKSTFLKLIEKLIGSDYATHLDLKDLDDPYMPATLFGKLVNIGDDIDYKGTKSTAILKKLVTGESVQVQEKYKSSFSFKNFATLIFTTNRLPRINDDSTGFYRRLIILDINKKVENPDPFFLEKLTETDMEYLFYKAIKAVREAIARNEFTKTATSEVDLERYVTEQSSVLMFLKDNEYDEDYLHLKACREIYAEYKEYCSEFGYKCSNRLNFQEKVMKRLPLALANTTVPGEGQAWRFKKTLLR